MSAFRIYRRLQDLLDVDPNGLPQSGVPRYHTDVSSFVVETIAGGAGGSFSLGASNLGNTLGQTGVTGTRVVLAGIGNLTLSQLTDANGGTISISGGTAGAGFSGGVSGGNTAGDTGATGTRLVFAGGNSITLSQATDANGGTVTISGATTSQSVQTQDRFDLTLDGNTAGALALVSSGTLTLAGGNNITLSQNGNAITVSGAAQSVQPETQTFVGGIIASDTTYTSGSIRFTGVGGGVTVSSNTGQRVDISVAAPVAQTGTQFSAGLTNSGNTSGNTGTVGGRLILVGTNNITLSGSTNGQSMTITMSGPTVGGAQTGISGLANSQTTYTSGTVSLSELGAITIRSTTGNQFQFSVNSQTAESQSMGMSNIGNTSGTTGIASGAQVRFLFAGGNNVTLSQSLNGASGTITISAFNQTAETAISGLANSQTTYTSGTVSLSELGAITIRSTTGNQFQFSVNAQTVESQSFGMSNIGNTSGTTGIASGAQVRFLFAGGNNITLSQSLNGASGTITISAPNAQTGISGIANSQTTYTSGTVSLSELGAITIRSTTGNQYQFSVNAQTGTQFSAGISGGNTSGDTGTVAGRVVLAGGNNVTLSGSTNGVSETITISAASQSVQTQGILSAGVSTGGNTAGNTQVSTGSRLVLVGSNGITASQGTAAGASTITLSGRDPYSAGMSTMGNTAGDTGYASLRFNLAGGNNITLSGSTNGGSMTISIAAPSPGAAQYSIGVSNLGNTAGSTGVTGTRIVFVGTNNISLSQSTDATGATISINNTVSAFQAGVSTGGNTAGDTGVTGTRLVFVGTNPISLSQATGANGGTISINAPATSSLSAVSGIKISTTGSTISIGFGPPLADWENMPRQQASLISHVSAFSKTPIYWNDHIDGDITANNLAFAISMVTASQPLSVSAHLGVYTLVNSTSAALLGSHSEAYVVSSASSVSLSGVRNIVMTGIGTHATLSSLTYGEYMFGMMFSATATNVMNFSLLGASGGAGPLGAIHPGTNQLSTGTTQGVQRLMGRGSVTVNAMPANVVASDLINQGTGASMALHPWIYIRS